jgi:hypothetical protein
MLPAYDTPRGLAERLRANSTHPGELTCVSTPENSRTSIMRYA